MIVKGIIHKIGETNILSEKFQKREVVIKTEEKYPQFIACQLTQEKCEFADKFKVNDFVEASINLRGREWETPQGEIKYFNTLEIWKLHGIHEDEKVEEKPEDDDLPF